MSYQAIAHAAPVIKVLAPSNLPGGHKFQTRHDGMLYDVVVPPGGVKKGHVFDHQLLPLGTPLSGEWRDGLFDCFRNGPCHPMVLMSAFFPIIAIAQVMTRMKLTWKGEYGGSPEEIGSTYMKLVRIYLAFLITSVAYNIAFPSSSDGMPATGLIPFLYQVYSITIWVYTIIVISRTRSIIRAQNSIPEKNFSGCEDVVCATFCHCCTIAQLGRHTANYDAVKATFFTSDGVEHVTVIEV